jgi:hypothetical protein
MLEARERRGSRRLSRGCGEKVTTGSVKSARTQAHSGTLGATGAVGAGAGAIGE